jgi:ABC-type transporter Mla MlaB component
MSLERKQHADLVRHRELNALRRLMVQRGAAQLPPLDERIARPPNAFAATNTIDKIDALEEQMSQQLFQRHTETEQDTGGFQLTQIEAFSNSVQTTQSMAIQMQEPSTLQQAGEHFANNKAQLAQNLLEQAIGERGLQHDRVPTWLALFDLYRATDQLDRFEALALDFSVRFGRSPPSWISIPEQAALAERERQPMQSTGHADWVAPPALTQTDLLALQNAAQAAMKASRQLAIDWRSFVATDAAQWRLLNAALHYLASQRVHCLVHGLAALEQSFDPNSAESLLAKLALVRCQNKAQVFEDMAIDYSVQFEISPPDWIKPECRFEAATVANAPSTKAKPPISLPPELYGTLDAARAVKALADWVPSEGMVIRCDRLVRCDPVAAMAIARFAEAAKAQGIQLELQGVHRVLAAYFAMKNLYDYAKVTIRRD